MRYSVRRNRVVIKDLPQHNILANFHTFRLQTALRNSTYWLIRLISHRRFRRRGAPLVRYASCLASKCEKIISKAYVAEGLII